MQFDNPVKPKLTAECEFKTQAGSLANALNSQFNLIDLNRDGQITREEVRVFSQRPNLSGENKAVVSFLNDHLEDISSLSDYGVKTLDRGAIEKLKNLAELDPSQSPSATEFISRGALGGAAGGATADFISDGKVGSGAGKGAAVGAVVGAIAYAAVEAKHNSDLKEVEKVKGWHYFDSTCTELEQNKPVMAERKMPLSNQKPKADDFRQLEKYLPQIDFNDDHEVSKAELKQAAQMGYVPDSLLPALQFTSANLTTMAEMNRTHINYNRDSVGVQASDLEQFGTALKNGHVNDFRMTNKEYWTTVGKVTAAGCGTGALAGLVVASPLPGCAIGGGIAGVGAMGITYLSKHQSDQFYPIAVHNFDLLQKKLQ